MESGGSANDKECVRVAVNVRPLITPELLNGCTDCITVTPGEPQVQVGSHCFTYDYVFGNGAIPCSRVFNECVAPLIDTLFRGYNGTVLAYGQTGSGKTYTMGTNYNGEAKSGGIIPQVMETIFSRVEAMKGSTEFLIKVSFIEIFKEEVFDLLDPNPPAASKADGVSVNKPTGPVRVPIQIRETVNAGITLAGVTEPEVRSKEEMASYLTRGSAARATGSTNMNSQSSRSHAIFTISMEQKRIGKCSAGSHDENSDDILSAKLHLVDLAGSERAKRTGADGMRFKEGIHINKGLLALSNVISALGDEKKRKEGGHVPYRDSKLTRLLQDSLGGNSKTVMIACVSPADTNAEETLNTLKYANRARNIQNKAVINRDPVAAQMQRMRTQIEQLQAELAYYRGDSSVPFDELQVLKHKISLLETSKAELQHELQERHISCEHLSQRAIEAQIEKDKLIMKLEAARSGKPSDEIDSQEIDLMKSYVSKIHELEGELVRLQNSDSLKRGGFSDGCESDDEGLISKKPYYSGFDELSSIADSKETTGEDVAEKELEHSSLQERLDRELKELDMKLEQKEAEMKRFAGGDTIVLKQHYDKKVLELEHEKKTLQKEIEDLRHKLSGISSTPDDGAKKLKEDYLQKLNLLESQVSELKKRQEAQAQLLKQKQKSDDAAKRLQDEIQRIKTQKVQLQNKIKQESEQFRMWKALREKEVLQLKKEGRRNEYEMHKLIALNQKQKTVLQRKTEEAAVATKRLKELLETRKTASREASGIGNSHGPGLQALMQGIEHELEVTVRVHEVRSQYERHMEERAKMAQEITRLKEEEKLIKQNKMSQCSDTMSPGARNSRISALENMLSTSSSTLVSMASHLSEAEERERTFSGRGRWNQVRTLAEAKNLMIYLFNIASSSRCTVRDKEIDCREKDAEIKELKEKVVKLSSLARQLEKENSKLVHQVHQQGAAISRLTRENNGETRPYDLRQGLRNSGLFKYGNSLELEDMDTSDSEHNTGDDSDDDWVHPMSMVEKKNTKKGRRSRSGSHSVDSDDGISTDTVTSDKEKSNSGVCCSCSKYSSCKTQKCECRAAGSDCTSSCGCSSTKCSNRNGQQVRGVDNGQQSHEELDQQNQDLASQGAALLQSALSGMHGVQAVENEVKRMPLSDIGNTAAKSNAPRPTQRKKWLKSVVQLIPATPPVTKPENSESPKQPENSTAEANIQLKLPRPTRSSASNSNLLRDRNLEQGEGPVARRPNNKSDQKENFGD